MPCPRFLAASIVLFALGCSSAHAQPASASTSTAAAPATQPASLKLKTERLVIFKDGHGLVIKTGSGVADAGGRAIITDVPDSAVLGCFWATSADDSKILAMRAEWDEQKEIRHAPTTCTTMAELLRANTGKAVTLELIGAGEKQPPERVSGTIVRLLDIPADDSVPDQTTASESGRPAPGTFTSLIRAGITSFGMFTRENLDGEGTLIRDLQPRGGEYVVISEANDRQLVLPVAHVQSIRGSEIATATTHDQERVTRTKRLSLDFGKASAGKNVTMRLFYFTPGLRWIPTYRVSGDLKDKADLALQGEIINEVTDVEHAALDLVVGVPNFRFADTVSPLTLEQTMRAALIAANVSLNNNGSSGGQSMLNSQFDNRARAGGAMPMDPAMNIAPEINGAGGEQDLFVYGLGDFSLKKGARATVPLWQQPAALRHVYTFDLNTRRSRAGGGLIDDSANPGQSEDEQRNDRSASGFGGRRGPNRIVMNQVWHQLELTNDSKVPWTTGAALMMRMTLPLGQDLLTYTPPTGKSLLPVTVAIDLRGSLDEQETGRKNDALQFDNEQYMRVTKKGTITVTSYRSEKSDMKITLGTAGKVSSASDNGTIKLNDARAGDWDERDNSSVRVNNHSDVTWDMTLEPGATKTITYEVSFYTR